MEKKNLDLRDEKVWWALLTTLATMWNTIATTQNQLSHLEIVLMTFAPANPTHIYFFYFFYFICKFTFFFFFK